METEQKSVDYQSVLVSLEAKRDALDNAISVIKSLIAEPGTVQTAAPGPKHNSAATLTPTVFFSLSVGDAAKKYLGIVKEPKTTPDIAKALESHGIKTVSKDFTVTVYSALDRRRLEVGDIVRPKRGLWGLAEWYPGLRKGKDNGNKKDSTESEKQKKSKVVPEKTTQSPPPSAPLSAASLEGFVKGKARRIKDAAAHFGVSNAEIKKLLEPASKVYLAGIAWLKLRE